MGNRVWPRCCCLRSKSRCLANKVCSDEASLEPTFCTEAQEACSKELTNAKFHAEGLQDAVDGANMQPELSGVHSAAGIEKPPASSLVCDPRLQRPVPWMASEVVHSPDDILGQPLERIESQHHPPLQEIAIEERSNLQAGAKPSRNSTDGPDTTAGARKSVRKPVRKPARKSKAKASKCELVAATAQKLNTSADFRTSMKPSAEEPGGINGNGQAVPGGDQKSTLKRSTKGFKPKRRGRQSSVGDTHRETSSQWVMSLRETERVSEESLKRASAPITVTRKPVRKSVKKVKRPATEPLSWLRPCSVGKGMFSVVWRLLCIAPDAMDVIAEKFLVRRWLGAFFDSPLCDPRRLELCYHGTTAEMVPMVMKCGFRLPKAHPCLYTTKKFKVANFYASSTRGGFHSACGAAFADLKQHEPSDLEQKPTPGSVFLCLGLNPEVGPAYLRYMKAEQLLPCYVVKSGDQARAAEVHLQPLIANLLGTLPWGGNSAILECFRTWSMIVACKL